MTKKKNSSKVMLYIAIVLSFLAVALNIFAIVVFSFEIKSVIIVIEKVLNSAGFTMIGADMSLKCIELAIVAFIDFFAGLRYINILRNKFNLMRVANTLIWQTVLQMFFGSLLAGIFGCIGINKALQQRQMPITQEEQVEYINDYKKKAMGEAISRLKELKAQGAISEEEYYETLNKILEG